MTTPTETSKGTMMPDNSVELTMMQAQADCREVFQRKPETPEDGCAMLEEATNILRYAALDAALLDSGEVDMALRVTDDYSPEAVAPTVEVSRGPGLFQAVTGQVIEAGATLRNTLAASMPSDKAGDAPPTQRQLDKFITDGCPRDALEQAGKRLKRLIEPQPNGPVIVERFLLGGICAVVIPIPRGDDDPEAEEAEAEEFYVSAAVCEAAASVNRAANPLAPLLRAWCSRPMPAKVSASNRTLERIMPASLAMAAGGDHRAGKRYAHAAHSVASEHGQSVMPGFQHERQAPALPLALYDLGLGASMRSNTNHAAPLALRLWVEAILAVMQRDRHGDHPVTLEITLRQLLARLYPGRTPRPVEYWPRLMEAIQALDSVEARVPWHNPDTNGSGLLRVVSVVVIPRGPDALDDVIGIDVHLPPGSGNGPQVPDSLPAWGVKSASAYRTLLNLSYWWYSPGVTLRPIARRTDGKGKLWTPSSRAEDYPEMSDAELVEIVFPSTKTDAFRVLKARAREVLAKLEKAGEIRIVDGKVLPPTRSQKSDGGE